jgi:hypothetical protein
MRDNPHCTNRRCADGWMSMCGRTLAGCFPPVRKIMHFVYAPSAAVQHDPRVPT